MFKSVTNMLVVVLMLVAFIGQALAVTTMSCEMPVTSHQSHQMSAMPSGLSDMPDNDQKDHVAMTHSTMSHESMKHDDTEQTSQKMNDDCCGDDCVCPKNACTTVALLPVMTASTVSFGITEAVASFVSQNPNTVSSSLYRPPIFA